LNLFGIWNFDVGIWVGFVGAGERMVGGTLPKAEPLN
jgi:hypothetical protein